MRQDYYAGKDFYNGIFANEAIQSNDPSPNEKDESKTSKSVPKLDVRYKLENYEKMIKEANTESVLKKIIYSLEKDVKSLQKTGDEFGEDEKDESNDNWKKNEEQEVKSFWPKTTSNNKVKELMPKTDKAGHDIENKDTDNRDEKSVKTFDFLPEYEALLSKARAKLKEMNS